MKRKTIRSIAAVGVFALVVTGLYATTALGAPTKLAFRFKTQPVDSETRAITGIDFVGDSGFVQVELFNVDTGQVVTNVKQTVTFVLAAGTLDLPDPQEDEPAAIGRLSVTPQPLVNGVATFPLGSNDLGTLRILDPNEPQFSSYALVPRNTKGALITGGRSNPFDIFEDGCNVGTGTCSVEIRGDTQQAGEDTYSLLSPGTLGASEIGNDNLLGFVEACEGLGQVEVFPQTVFVHETTDADTPNTPDPVLVTIHITKADMKAFPQNGQSHILLCTATLSEQPWIDNGGDHTDVAVDVTGNGNFLFVGIAPPCPQANPSSKTPCVVSQNGDGAGGNITTAYLQGGDPPRRT